MIVEIKEIGSLFNLFKMKFSFFPPGINKITSKEVIKLQNVYFFIRDDQWLKERTIFLRALTKEKQDRFKREDLEYVTIGGIFKVRRDDEIVETSGLVCIDLDDLDDPELLKKRIIGASTFIVLAFLSPRGKGLKLVFRCNPTISFKENYSLCGVYLETEFDVPKKSIDPACASISRACFLCHDPEVYLNPLVNEKDSLEDIPFLPADLVSMDLDEETDRESKIFESRQYLFSPLKLDFDKRHSIDNFIVLCRIDIKNNGDFTDGNRHNWVLKLALMCNSFGMRKESAIRHFKELFKNHPAVLSASHPFDEVSDLIRPFDDVYEKYKDEFESWDNNNEEYLTPCLPDEIFDELPHFIKKLTGRFSDKRERDVFFLGLLTLLSTCIPLIQGVYDKKRVRANLFTFISAPAASGKGVLSWVKKLGEVIHESFLTEYKQELAKYESVEDEERQELKKPELRRLFIAADNTSASIISNLGINEFFGIIYDNEADTLTKANKSEHGNFSNLLRKGFHHESIHYERKTNNQNIFIKEPAFSILISGTPGQIERLVDDVENGLTSRFIFYNYVSPVKWRDVFEGDDDLNWIFKSCAVELSQLSKIFFPDFINNPESEILFELTREQKKLLNSWFEEKVTCLDGLYGTDIRGCVFRLGVILFRIAMILSTMRRAEEVVWKTSREQGKIVCSDTDFKNAMSLIQTLLHHTVSVYNRLKKKGRVKRNKNIKDKYYESLLPKFNRATAMEIAALMEIKESTAENYLSLFVKDGKLTKPQHNHYEKSAG